MTTWFYVDSESKTLDEKDVVWSERSWVVSYIFNRIASFFRHFEVEQRDDCFTDRGCAEPEIDLTDISKDSFNIFCLRCREAFTSYNIKPPITEFDEGITYYWKHILSMLEKDKRYDPDWIKQYERESLMVDCFGYET